MREYKSNPLGIAALPARTRRMPVSVQQVRVALAKYPAIELAIVFGSIVCGQAQADSCPCTDLPRWQVTLPTSPAWVHRFRRVSLTQELLLAALEAMLHHGCVGITLGYRKTCRWTG